MKFYFSSNSELTKMIQSVKALETSARDTIDNLETTLHIMQGEIDRLQEINRVLEANKASKRKSSGGTNERP